MNINDPAYTMDLALFVPGEQGLLTEATAHDLLRPTWTEELSANNGNGPVTVIVSDVGFQSYGGVYLFTSFLTQVNTRVVALEVCNFPEESVIPLQFVLHKTVEHLCFPGDEAYRTPLRCVKISNTQLNVVILESCGKMLLQQPSLQTLELSNVGADAPLMKLLCDILKPVCRQLVELDMSNNRLGGETDGGENGIFILSDILPFMTKLERLYLCSNGFTAVDTRNTFRALTRPRAGVNLREIKLQNCSFGEEDDADLRKNLTLLRAVLDRHKNLKSVDVTGCGLTRADVTRIAERVNRPGLEIIRDDVDDDNSSFSSLEEPDLTAFMMPEISVGLDELASQLPEIRHVDSQQVRAQQRQRPHW